MKPTNLILTLTLTGLSALSLSSCYSPMKLTVMNKSSNTIVMNEEKENILIENDWNQLEIKVKGERVITWLNNEMMTDLKDSIIGEAEGVIALQIHDGGGIKVKWRNIYIREI